MPARDDQISKETTEQLKNAKGLKGIYYAFTYVLSHIYSLVDAYINMQNYK